MSGVQLTASLIEQHQEASTETVGHDQLRQGWVGAERTAHPRLRWLIRRCRPLGVSGHVGFRAFNRSGSKGLTQDTRHGKRQTTAKLHERDCQQRQPPIECIRRNFYPATFSLLTDLDRTLEVSLYCVSGHWLGRYLSQLRAKSGHAIERDFACTREPTGS
jgi:hypothetical protein